MQATLFLVIFAFIYVLHNKINLLQKELNELKRKYISQSPIEPNIREGTISELPVHYETFVKKIPIDPVKSVSHKVLPESEKEFIFDKQEPSKFILLIQNYFTSGNIVVRIGGVVLFFGLAFLVKYMAAHSTISIEVRLFGVALSALVICGIGWWLRKREGYYGLILQGIGVAILYLVVFGAAKIYGLIPLSLAFLILLTLVIATSILAITQNALPLALFAISGGFLTPILTSDGSGSHVVLFSYYALLNLGIVGIAWYRSWRVLNLSGFVFTFVIATAWGVLRYRSEFLWSTEPFLILFFLFYLVVSILFTQKQSLVSRRIIDATIVFGLPIIAFSLQASLVHCIPYALAWSAFALGSLYLILYKIFTQYVHMKLLKEAFLALGVVFYTIAIGYTFSDEVSAMLWAIEGVGVLWVSLRQEQRYAQLFAQALQIIATGWYLFSSLSFDAKTPFLNSGFLGFFIIMSAHLLSSYLLYMEAEKLSKYEKNNSLFFLCTALALWFYAGFVEAERFNFIPLGNILLIYTALSAFCFAMIAWRFNWHTLALALEFYLPLGMMLMLSLLKHYFYTHPFEGIGSGALILFFAVHYLLLYLFDTKWHEQILLHVGGVWLIALIGASEFLYAFSLITPNMTWQYASFIAPVQLLALLILKVKNVFPGWLKAYQQSYQSMGVGGLLVITFLWETYALKLNGDPSPFTYIPFFNPLDAMQIAGLVLLYQWSKTQPWQNAQARYSVGALMLFVLLTVILARSVHVYVHIDYTVFALSHSILFQSALSILWSLLAMITIIGAKIRHQRELWLAGAGLLGIVVLKLFVVELSSSGTIERIISFIVVGVLMLLIGYFAPLPPKKEEV